MKPRVAKWAAQCDGIIGGLLEADLVYIDGLVQERRYSSALAMELRLFVTNSSMGDLCIVYVCCVVVWGVCEVYIYIVLGV